MIAGKTIHVNRRALKLALVVAAALSIGLIAGCKDSGPGSAVFTRKGNAPFRIAVLPFTSPERQADAGPVVTSTVITYLLSTGAVEVIEPGLVDKAMRAAKYAPEFSSGLDPDTLAALQQNLNVDAYLVGNVEEFGEVRVGPDTYPAISFSARLIRASDDTIIWAASISRTGADKIKVFDIGRVSSIGKLTKAAVAEMAASLRAGTTSFTQPAAPAFSQSSPRPAAITPPVTKPQMGELVPGAKTFALKPLFADEGRSYGQADFAGFLIEVPPYTRGPVSYTKHAFNTVTTLYSTNGTAIDVKLVDYQKVAVAEQFIVRESEGLHAELLDSLKTFSGPSDSQRPGVFHFNVAAGRFGLYLTGPESTKEQFRPLAVGLIAAR